MIILLLLLLILSLAAFYDYKKGKIPNYLIVIGAIGGVFRLIILQDVFAIVGYTPGIILPLVLFYPVYKIGGMGAGDLKIFSMLGIYFSFTLMFLYLYFYVSCRTSFFSQDELPPQFFRTNGISVFIFKENNHYRKIGKLS